MFEKLLTEEKSMMHQDSLEPAAIRFTLKRLQEPAFLFSFILSLSQQSSCL